MYNLTNITSSEGNLLNLAVATNNDLLGGFFFVGVTLVLFVIMVVSMSNRFGIMPSLAASSFTTGLAGLFFSIVGLIGGQYVIYYLIFMSLVGAALFVWSQQGS